MPVILELKKSDEVGYQRRLTKLFSVMTLIAFSMVIVISLSSSWVIPFMFSNKYVESIPILNIHIWSIIFVFWGMTQTIWDMAENMLPMALVRNVLGAITKITLNYFLITKIGALGAAWSTVIAFALMGFFFNLLHPKTIKIFWMEIRALTLPGILRKL